MNASATLGKDLTGLEHMTPEQIRLILDTAEPFKEVSERPIKKVPALRGKTSWRISGARNAFRSACW